MTSCQAATCITILFSFPRLENLKKLVASIPYLKGSTATDKALKLASSELFTESGGDRPDKPNVLLIFTDGKADLETEPFSTVLPPLKVILTVVVNKGVTKRYFAMNGQIIKNWLDWNKNNDTNSKKHHSFLLKIVFYCLTALCNHTGHKFPALSN